MARKTDLFIYMNIFMYKTGMCQQLLNAGPATTGHSLQAKQKQKQNTPSYESFM